MRQDSRKKRMVQHLCLANVAGLLHRGFIKVLNSRATGFDAEAKNWLGHAPLENLEIL